jgi:hypothetical protein
MPTKVNRQHNAVLTSRTDHSSRVNQNSLPSLTIARTYNIAVA